MSIILTRTIASLGLACALAATPALAAPEAQSRVVRFADLDLATPAGEQALRVRIKRAVAQVCGDADQRDLRAMSAIHVCRTIAMANVASQVQVAIANAHSGKAYATNTVKVAPAMS